MTEKEYPGLTVSLPLFFNSDESIDYENLERYINDLAKLDHISAVYSMAYNTRYKMLDDDELLDLNIKIIQLSRDNNMDCYVGHPYIFDKKRLYSYLDKIAKYAPAGISMLYPERYFNIDKPILEFLKMPSKLGLKVVLHEMKLVSGFNGELINWPVDLLRKVIQLDCIIGVKEDSKDDEITNIVLQECKKNNVTCILAGGGKSRALKFISKGLTTWLNGSTMFCPKAIDVIYPAVMNNQTDIINYYIENVETPFFNDVVNRYGWHISHKAALEYFGYGKRYERFPHASLPEKDFEQLELVFSNIKNTLEKII
tara:strand:+ start:1345 stop:2283 length:939 start_codon:yes stop_codon:yes gene_type:complete